MQPARTLDQILSELNPVYEPQVQNIRQRQALIPGQIADEEKGLEAKKTSAFDSILGGARQRGLGFSGIPLAEQAKYTSTDYLPALARLRTQGREQALSLEDAILGINERKQNSAMQMRQYEQQRYDQEMARLRAEEQQRQASAAQASAIRMANSQSAPRSSAPKTDTVQQTAFNDAYSRIQSQSDAELISDFNATAKSAGYGNVKDKYKLEVYRQYRPDLFGNMGGQAISNYSQLRF